MEIQEVYTFNSESFDKEGIRKTDGKFFLEIIEDFEADFYQKHPFCFPNHIFAHAKTMQLFNCALGEENEICGMELIEGEIDLDANLKMEEYSRYSTIYAIGSKLEGNEEEPVFLVLNDKLSKNCIVMKYISDGEAEDETKPIPVNCDMVKV